MDKTIDYHKGYILLVSILIQYENDVNNQKEILCSQNFPLSSYWLKLLDQYALLFGIKDIYRYIM